MKALFAALIIMALALPAMAEPIRNPAGAYTATPFNQYTGFASTARYSAAQKVDRNTKKTVIFVGYSTNGTDQLASLPGTAAIQCGPTASGPWVTAKDTSANAISGTSSAVYNLDGYCSYLRASWTKTGSGKRSITTYILYGDQ